MIALITERIETEGSNKERIVDLTIFPASAENLGEGAVRIDLRPSWVQENRQREVIRQLATIRGSLGPSFFQLVIETKIVSHAERLEANRSQTPWPLIEQSYNKIVEQ